MPGRTSPLIPFAIIISSIILIFGMRSCSNLNVKLSDSSFDSNKKLTACLFVIDYTKDEMPHELEQAMKKAIKSCEQFNVYIAKPESATEEDSL